MTYKRCKCRFGGSDGRCDWRRIKMQNIRWTAIEDAKWCRWKVIKNLNIAKPMALMFGASSTASAIRLPEEYLQRVWCTTAVYGWLRKPIKCLNTQKTLTIAKIIKFCRRRCGCCCCWDRTAPHYFTSAIMNEVCFSGRVHRIQCTAFAAVGRHSRVFSTQLIGSSRDAKSIYFLFLFFSCH